MENEIIVAENVADIDNRQGDDDKNRDDDKISEIAAEKVANPGTDKVAIEDVDIYDCMKN